jgi:hypothetical protein
MDGKNRTFAAELQGMFLGDGVSCTPLGAVDAAVLLEVLLRNAVECERGNRAFEERSCHTPCASGATPAAEVVAIDADQAFVHTSAFACVWIRAWARRGGIHRNIQRGSELLPAGEYLLLEAAARPSN